MNTRHQRARNPSGRHAAGTRGVTLIELLVVIALVGVLLGLILVANCVWLACKPAGRHSGSAPRSALSG
jgi:prepilin-type N-terminal cleavage/methylation domain-containing protein